MGATLYKEHKVFVMDLGLSEGGLFGSETVIVAALRCEKNCYPHSYRWSVEFIGGAQAFTTQYVPRTAYFFTDGIAQGKGIRNGKTFENRMEKLYSQAGPLTVQDMHDMGFHGYSWSKGHGETFSDLSPLTLVSTWLGERYTAPVKTQTDIENLIRQAYEVQAETDSGPWFQGLWSIDRQSMAEISLTGGIGRAVSL